MSSVVRAAVRALVALCVLAAAAPASAAVTRVTLDVPTAGDASYGVVQVKLGKQSGKAKRGRDRAFAGKVGGLSFDVRSKSWRKLRKSTKIYVAASRVNGEPASLRNAVIFVTRAKPGTGPKNAKITITIRNASASKSFWVKKVDKRGNATNFKVRNIISTAVGNWSRYLSTLGAARAFRAAAKPVDVKGRFKEAYSAQQGTISRGGHKMSPAATALFNLIFGTIGDSSSYQAAKRSPIVSEFIAKELKNTALAAKWSGVSEKLPLAVPDTYAAAAKQEAQFSTITPPKVSRTKVVIADLNNSTRQAAIETPRLPQDTVPGYRVNIQLAGDGAGNVKSDVGAINCPPTCTHFYTSGGWPIFTATPDEHSNFLSYEGCTNAVDGVRCRMRSDSRETAATKNVVATFGRKPGAPAPPVVPPSPTGPVALDSTFGSGGTTFTPFAQGTTPRSAYANAVTSQGDGKLVVAGARENAGPGSYSWVLARYSADGALDATFNPGGSPAGTLVLNESGFGARAVVVEPDGDINIAGETETPVGNAAARVYQVTATGSFTTFGGSPGTGIGQVEITGANATSVEAMERQPDGKLLLAGTANFDTGPMAFAARLNADGTPDIAFAPGGYLLIEDACDPVDPLCMAYSMDVKYNGTNVEAVYIGGLFTGSPFSGRVFKLVPTSGQAIFAEDDTFGTQGGAQIDNEHVVFPYALQLTGDGRILAAGGAFADLTNQCGIVRLTSSGALDSGFDGDGVGRIDRANGCMINSIAQQADGKIVFVGESYDEPYLPVIGRFTATGQPDTGFASGGVTAGIDAAHEPGFFNDVLLQGGKPVAVGGANLPHELLLARYTAG